MRVEYQDIQIFPKGGICSSRRQGDVQRRAIFYAGAEGGPKCTWPVVPEILRHIDIPQLGCL